MARHPRRNQEFWSSARWHSVNFQLYYARLTEIAISSFKWYNLPPTIDERFLELVLFSDGKVVFFEEPDIGFLALRTMADGMPNVYDIPTRREAFASNGFHRVLSPDDSVLIWNNRLRSPSRMDIEAFSLRLANLDETIDTNVNAQKTPIIIVCDEHQRLTLKNMYMQYEGNMPVIFGDKNLNIEGFRVLETGAPFVSKDLYELKQNVWNEAMTYLGVPNLAIEKRERLIIDEVHRSQGGTMANRNSRLAERQTACELINRMYGLNIWCEFRDDGLPTTVSNEKGGEEDE